MADLLDYACWIGERWYPPVITDRILSLDLHTQEKISTIPDNAKSKEKSPFQAFKILLK